ncbi:MAG: hypothetical protein M9894_05710 [Planctomycetes bacterium]|nr:hypothetical protein [Planctomycetota bacterium]
MSDARRRARERASLDDAGDVAARARALVERLRAGALAPARLRLAAYLGHAPARAALGLAAPAPLSLAPPRGLDPPPDPEHAPAWLAMRIVDHWLAEWAAFGDEVPVAAALAVGRRALADLAPPPDARARMAAALDAVQAWVDAPGPPAAEGCARALRLAWPGFPPVDPRTGLRARLLELFPGVPEALLERLVFLPAAAPVAAPAEPGRRATMIGRWLDDAVLAWGTAWVRDAVVEGVVPWALGGG